MTVLIIAVSAAAAMVLLVMPFTIRIVQQYEIGVHFRLGRVIAARKPGLTLIVPIIDNLHRVSLRIVTMPIPAQEIITRDNVSINVAAVAYFKVIDAVKSVVAIENVRSAINSALHHPAIQKASPSMSPASPTSTSR